MAKILVADVPEMHQRMRECLPCHDCVFVTTMADAVDALRHDRFGMVIVGLHFDESRMFELLTYVRTLAAYKDAPVVCVQGLDIPLPESVMRTVDRAVKALGGTAFVDLRDEHDFRRHCDFLDRAASAGGSLRPS